MTHVEKQETGIIGISSRSVRRVGGIDIFSHAACRGYHVKAYFSLICALKKA